MSTPTFLHCDNSEAHLSLHDCTCSHAYFCGGIIGFEFDDGFWILPDHPESSLAEVVRTDSSKAEYVLQSGSCDDVTVYVYKKTLFGRTVRQEWDPEELIRRINSQKYRLEFLYQYRSGNSRIIECELHFDRRPYHMQCDIHLTCAITHYCWNNLCADKPW